MRHLHTPVAMQNFGDQHSTQWFIEQSFCHSPITQSNHNSGFSRARAQQTPCAGQVTPQRHAARRAAR